MKQALILGGGVVVEEVPAPQVGRKNILVRVESSCVSVGTELGSVKTSGTPFYKRALQQPENVKRVIGMARDYGIKRTVEKVRGRLATGIPVGYSAAGVVIEVGADAEGFAVGDKVACAGAGIANHAEIIDVPVNLAVRIPDGVGFPQASTVALGSIALQGVRRAAPTLGETVAVIGLGVLGRITAQALAKNGCRVIGTDLDKKRLQAALDDGMEYAVDPSSADFVERCHTITGKVGVDAVIITAATASHDVVSQAMKACRKKGRVVLVGDVGLNLDRADFYAKELDFFISSSYGPGRYDPLYEQEGLDYPVAYVRWTENRNMAHYLKLLSGGSITLDGMYEEYLIDNAPTAYDKLKGSGEKPVMVILTYPERKEAPRRLISVKERVVVTKKSGAIGVALVGSGGFALSTHLPNMMRMRDNFDLRHVMSRTGATAMAVAKQYGAKKASTDYEEVLSDPAVDLVIITTRHDSHGDMVMKALIAGKNVFVEKPLTIDESDLDRIESFYLANENGPLLLVGYNRRFSPAINLAVETLKGRSTPMMVNYRMNAGYLSPEHWTRSAEGGGRNIGEACHIYDLFNRLTGSRVVSVKAMSISPGGKNNWGSSDNFAASISYEDGSLCTLTYTALGSPEYPKERMDIFADGVVITLDDYRSLKVAGCKGVSWNSQVTNKGHFRELAALRNSLTDGAKWPIPLEEQLSSSRVAFEVERQIHR